MNLNSTVVNLFVSFASLLPGDPADCVDPTNINDESCSGGLASVASFIRHSQQRGDGPAVHIPHLDRMSKFVQMHPLGWGVNKLISHDQFGWKSYFAPPSLFSAHGDRDLSNLQTHDFSPLLTNIALRPKSSWFHYHQSIHFDYDTATAHIIIDGEQEPFAEPAVESLVASLDYVADLNDKSGCFDIDTGNLFNDGIVEEEGSSLNSHCTDLESRCWSPIVFFHESLNGPYEECLEAALNHPHAPLVFYDVNEHGEDSSSGTIVNNTIICHGSDSADLISHLRVEVGPYDTRKKRPITHMAYSEVDLTNLPPGSKDATYIEDLKYLRELADQAITNDPIVGMSGYMPFTRLDNWRMCMGGECPIGNLFTDALRWATDADFAVESSGGLRGPGWDEGPVRISDIWAALPFVNFPCTGVMSGVSVFQLLNYSTAVATFESTNTPMGDRLLQMSGMRITYNTLVNGTGPGRLMSVDIWDKSAEEYLPLDGLKMYKFATTSWMCDHFDPYPSLFGRESNVDRDRNVQGIVSDFLASLKEPYDTSIQGRLVNNTEAFTPLDVTLPAPVQSSGDQSVSIAGIMAILLAGLLVGSTILFTIYRQKDKRIIESQQDTIRQNQTMLAQNEKELAFSFKLGTSKFGDAVNFIDSLLKKDNPQIGPNDVDKLILVKSCLTSGSDDKAMHVPNNLSESYRDLFLLKEFAGIDKPRGLVKQGKFRKLTLLTKTIAAAPVVGTLDCLTEFISLDVDQQAILFEILSFPNLRQWCFNIFDVSAIDEVNTLLFVAWAILGSPHSQFAMAKELGRDVALDDFEGYDFLGIDLSVEMSTLINYIRVIQRDYNDTPYHNAIHAADVVQTIHSMIQMAGENLFEKEEMFTIILAAVVHDVKHPGFNNNFQVNSISSLALTHNDSAVLENEHASHAFKVLVKGVPGEFDNLNFLRNSDVSDFSKFRRKVMSAVLHTDMSNHFSTVAKMKNLAVGQPWDQMDSNLRWEILSFMLHLSDISNPAKEDPMTKLWTDRCLEEFFRQGDKEIELGLPVSLNCCRKETKKPDAQIGFINFIVKPSYEVLGDIIPEVGKVVLPILENNLMYWEGQKLWSDNDA